MAVETYVGGLRFSDGLSAEGTHAKNYLAARVAEGLEGRSHRWGSKDPSFSNS